MRDLASGRHPPFRAGEVTLATLAGRALMTTASRRLAWALSIVAASLALAAPAGAQFAGGRSAFDQRPGPEPVQFRDFFGGERRSSYPNNSYQPFWGDRRPSYPNNSYDPYNPFYRRPQVYDQMGRAGMARDGVVRLHSARHLCNFYS